MSYRNPSRIRINRSARVTCSDSSSVSCTAIDLSLTACSIVCRYPAEVPTLLHINIPLGFPYKVVAFQALARVARYTIANRGYHILLGFERYSGDSRELLRSFIDYRLKHRPRFIDHCTSDGTDNA